MTSTHDTDPHAPLEVEPRHQRVLRWVALAVLCILVALWLRSRPSRSPIFAPPGRGPGPAGADPR